MSVTSLRAKEVNQFPLLGLGGGQLRPWRRAVAVDLDKTVGLRRVDSTELSPDRIQKFSRYKPLQLGGQGRQVFLHGPPAHKVTRTAGRIRPLPALFSRV